mgnify:CR=1 FL=1
MYVVVTTSFNPTLVRFCPTGSGSYGYTLTPFQSHLGSILPWSKLRLRSPHDPVSIPPWFDFASIHPVFTYAKLGVSIPPWFDFAPSHRCRAPIHPAVSIPPWFDFASNASSTSRCPFSFQSHLGSILPLTTPCTITHDLRVSIPPWFDFAAVEPLYRLHHVPVSIPPWFDFAHLPPCQCRWDCAVSIPPWFDFAPRQP